MSKPHIVVFTGAGVSAESGLKTFRDSDGLWEEYNVMEVATPEAWQKDPATVLEFYNKRRKQIIEAQPNGAHEAVAQLEKRFKVTVITQNIDNLHEKAGSKNVLHLHGIVTSARSTNPVDQNLYPIKGFELNIGDKCPAGYQLRPHVVWFGEDVPLYHVAKEIVGTADILLIAGTSLSVYPAAGLIFHARKTCKTYLIDPNDVQVSDLENLEFIKQKASTGIPMLAAKLLS